MKFTKFKKKYYFVLLLLHLFTTVTNAGFIPGTLVHSSNDITAIEELSVGDSVLSFDGHTLPFCSIVDVHKKLEEHVASILLDDNQLIICSQNQKFYLHEKNTWIYAKDLQPSDCLFCCHGDFVSVASVRILQGQFELHELTVQDTHVFYVTERGVLVHNALPVVFGVAWTIGGGVEFCASLGIGFLGYFGINFLKKKSGEIKFRPHIEIEPQTFAGGGGPKKDDDEKDKLRISEKDKNHIFRDSEGHFPKDTPESRTIIEDMVNEKSNLDSFDTYGTAWYSKIMGDGRQIWAGVRDNAIRYAGVNKVPWPKNNVTGLLMRPK